MKFIQFCNKIIEYSFYAIFFLVPLIFSQFTSELFELNKIWLLYGITIIIAGAWLTKMVLEKNIRIQRTFLDIPIVLFLLSQILATIFSFDQHISFYGYYSRFNGGLLSTLTYIFLYYAFVSNLSLREVGRSISVTLIAGTVVALWGFPAHFGNDPTCLLFRGTFDTSCWTEAFHPTVRIFSTLGQPAWLAAYLTILIPLALSYMLLHDPDSVKTKKSMYWYATFFIIVLLFYADLLFTNTRAGYVGFLFGYLFFWMMVFLDKIKPTENRDRIIILSGYVIANIGLLYATVRSSSLVFFLSTIGFLLFLIIFKRFYLRTFLLINISLLVVSFMFQTPIGNLKNSLLVFTPSSQNAAPTPQEKSEPAPQAGTVLDTNITDSGNIRKIVWSGAIDIWKSRPLFGTGVETFAFAYYKHRPIEHNYTSEWDYLYNKAHNEFLNYLATTGIFGLGTYILFIGTVFLLFIQKYLLQQKKHDENSHHAENHTASDTKEAALFAGFVGILITNFFGFSVVIINLYFFLIPAFLLYLLGKINEDHALRMAFAKEKVSRISALQWTGVTLILICASYFLLTTFRTWRADRAYALGYNLNRVGDFQNAYMTLSEAVKLRESEPVFRDELALTNATIASILYEQKDTVNAPQFATTAVALSNDVTTKYPNNILFWKNRFKIFYLIASSNPPERDVYLNEAIVSLERVLIIAPTDAKTTYNLGLLYRDAGQIDKAQLAFEKAVQLKPDYRDAYFALGQTYHTLSATDPTMQQKAVETMQYILNTFNKDDAEAIKSLTDWNVLSATDAATQPINP